jgi:hypothetical protein
LIQIQVVTIKLLIQQFYFDYLYLNQQFIVTICIWTNSLLWLSVFESTVYCDYLYLNQQFILTTCIWINSFIVTICIWINSFIMTICIWINSLLWLPVFESTVYCDYLYLNQQFYCDYLYLNQQFIVSRNKLLIQIQVVTINCWFKYR